MRLLGTIALFLLAVMQPSSSDGDQSASLPPSPTLPTNDDAYENPSLRNSPGNSTIRADSAENETTSTTSLADSPIASATSAVNSTELEEGQAEIENPSTHDVVVSTPSQEEYDDEEDEAASSQVDDPQAEPSQSAGDVQSQPQSGEFPPTQTNETENFDGISADQLKIKLEEATKELDTAKEATRKANETLAMKQKEAEQPNKDYTEKKKKYDELEAIAVEKETAEREYDEASSNLTDILGLFNTAELELNTTTKELEKAVKLEEEMPSWNSLLQDAQNKETTKTAEVQPLKNQVTSTGAVKKIKYKEWKNAIDAAGPTEIAFGNEKCDETPQSTSAVCVGLIEEKDRLNGLVDTAKAAYDGADLQLNTTQQKLDNLLNELTELKTEIGRLAINIATMTEDKLKELINTLKGELEGKNEKYSKVKSEMEKAEAELEKKKTAKEAAEQSDGGISSADARQEAVKAKAIKIHAGKAKNKADNEVAEQSDILRKAKESETKLNDRVDLLQKKYKEALKKEEPQTGSGVALPVGLGIGALMLIAIAVVIIIVCMKRKKKKGGSKPKKPEKSRGASTGKESSSDVLNPSVSKTSVPAGDPKATNIAPGPQGPSVPPTPKGPTGLPETPAQGVVSARAPNIQTQDEKNYLPDLEKEPYVEGEEPYKIPARNFKWLGPLRRMRRWHGSPKHDLDGVKLPEKLENIWFDPNANYASEIGANEIMEDNGPASDSDRSEWLNNLDEWEKGHAALMAARAEEEAAKSKIGKVIPKIKQIIAERKMDKSKTKSDRMIRKAIVRVIERELSEHTTKDESAK